MPLPPSNLASHPAHAGPRHARNLAELVAAIEQAHHLPVVNLREALLQLAILDEDQLEALEQEDPNLLRSRSEELVERVLITEDNLHRALARVGGLADIEVLDFDVARDAFDVLSLSQAHGHHVVPLGMASDHFYVASCTPTQEELYHQLCSLTGHSVALVWASSETIERRLEAQDRIARAGHGHSPHEILDELRRRFLPQTDLEQPQEKSAKPNLEDLVMQAIVEVGGGSETDPGEAAVESAGLVRLVNQMMGEALEQHASDIHIETSPGEALTAIRFRRDGDLEPYLWVPAKLCGPFVARIKKMAGLNSGERIRPQEGMLDFAQFGGQALELRVAVLPTHDGHEDVMLRLLVPAKPRALRHLGLQPRDQEWIAALAQRHEGLVLVVGPPGSGRTTSAHSMLAEISAAERKIWTAEDPIEITQPGLRQVQLNPKIGLGFASAVRGFSRAGADVILIGEIRDAETAQVAMEASQGGKLVLSTLQADGAAASLALLLELGLDPVNVASAFTGVVAQCLVRSLCPHCAHARPLDEAAWDALLQEYLEGCSLSRQQGEARLLMAAGVQSSADVRTRHAVGCEHCADKGYKGRVGVFEILQIGKPVQQLIQNRAHPFEIFDAAVAEGMRSLRHDALEKVVQGRIDLKQARVAYRSPRMDG